MPDKSAEKQLAFDTTSAGETLRGRDLLVPRPEPSRDSGRPVTKASSHSKQQPKPKRWGDLDPLAPGRGYELAWKLTGIGMPKSLLNSARDWLLATCNSFEEADILVEYAVFNGKSGLR